MVGAHLRFQLVEVRLEGSQVSDRLAVALHRRGAPGSEGGQTHQSIDIATDPGVVGRPRHVVAEVLHRPKHLEIYLPSPDLGKVGLDRATGELVTEGECVLLEHHHPGRLRLTGGLFRGPENRVHQLQLGPARHHRNQIDQSPRSRRETRDPPHHGVPHRARDRLVLGAQDLSQEEGVAPGQLPQTVSGPSCLRCQLGHRCRRERGQGDPLQDRSSDVGQGHTQRTVAWHLPISIGEHQQAVAPADSSTEELDQIERGLVGPVDVFDDDHSGSQRPGHELEDEGEHLVAILTSQRFVQ